MNKLPHYIAGFLLCYLVFSLIYKAMYAVQTSLGVIPAAEAYQGEDFLVFHPNVPDVTIVLAAGFWQLNGAPAYKNERLRDYQLLLRKRGITNRDHLRLLTAQLLTENGALAEDIDGDGGCSIGIPQRNVCLYGFSAKTFRKKYPVWTDWRFQISWMADKMAHDYDRFNGNIHKAVLAHNCPACAMRGASDTKAGYYRKVSAQAAFLSLL